MKNFVLFIFSFIIVYTVLQVFSGLVLTFLYEPNFNASLAGQKSPALIPTFLIAIFSAIIAYLVPSLIDRFSKRKKEGFV